MFYSAHCEIDCCTKLAGLIRQGDTAFWRVVPIRGYGLDLQCHFALLNEQTGPLGRIIAALTGSPSYHVETYLGDNAPAEVREIAEAGLGRPYDYEGALRAWNDSGFHTPGREFCSGWAAEILGPEVQGLSPYPNPGKLMLDLAAMQGVTLPEIPKLDVRIGDKDTEYLYWLRDQGHIATGVLQETLLAFEA